MNMRRRKFKMQQGKGALAEKLQEMLELFEQKEVFYRMIQTREHGCMFQQIQQELQTELRDFKNVQKNNPPIPNKEIPGKESVPIVLLCMMAGVSDEELFQTPNELDFALRSEEAEEAYGITAENMFYELYRSGLKGKNPRDLLKEFF